jgi:hypothetical protein
LKKLQLFKPNGSLPSYGNVGFFSQAASSQTNAQLKTALNAPAKSNGVELAQVNGDGLSQANGDGISQANGDGLAQVNGDGLSQANGDGISQANGDGLSQVTGDGLGKKVSFEADKAGGDGSSLASPSDSRAEQNLDELDNLLLNSCGNTISPRTSTQNESNSKKRRTDSTPRSSSGENKGAEEHSNKKVNT